LWLRPPSLWLTINPIDYEDLIAQIFARENIDMDAFCNVMVMEDKDGEDF
jgi:hypothetical protein